VTYDGEAPMAGAVERQVRLDIDAMGDVDHPMAESLAEMAYSLARRLEDPEEKSPAAVAKELRAVLADLADAATDPEDPLGDELSEPV
jgi:hypothetical protein